MSTKAAGPRKRSPLRWMRGTQGELISTNAVEGLFSRMKRQLRTYRASPSDKSQYGDYMGEFLWRMRFVRSDKWLHENGTMCPVGCFLCPIAILSPM